MLVSKVLQGKEKLGVITIKPSASLNDALKMLDEHSIGTVIVSQTGVTADGILSERDIVRQLARKGGGILTQPVSDFMTKDPVTCRRDQSIANVLETMTNRRFRHMPIVEDGVLVGIITIGDAVKAQISELSMEKDALESMIAGN